MSTSPFAANCFWVLLAVSVCAVTAQPQLNCYFVALQNSSQFPTDDFQVINMENRTSVLQSNVTASLAQLTPKDPDVFCQKTHVQRNSSNGEVDEFEWGIAPVSNAMNHSCGDILRSSTFVRGKGQQDTIAMTQCLCCGDLCNDQSLDNECSVSAPRPKRCYAAVETSAMGPFTSSRFPSSAAAMYVTEDEQCLVLRRFKASTGTSTYAWAAHSFNQPCGQTLREEHENGDIFEFATCCGDLCNGDSFQPEFGTTDSTVSTPARTSDGPTISSAASTDSTVSTPARSSNDPTPSSNSSTDSTVSTPTRTSHGPTISSTTSAAQPQLNCYYMALQDSSQFPSSSFKVINMQNWTSVKDSSVMASLAATTLEDPVVFCQKTHVRTTSTALGISEVTDNFGWGIAAVSNAMNYSCGDILRSSRPKTMYWKIKQFTISMTSFLCCGDLCNDGSLKNTSDVPAPRPKLCYADVVDSESKEINPLTFPDSGTVMNVTEDEQCLVLRHFKASKGTWTYTWAAHSFNQPCGQTLREEHENGDILEYATCCGDLCNDDSFQPVFGTTAFAVSTPARPPNDPTTLSTSSTASTVSTAAGTSNDPTTSSTASTVSTAAGTSNDPTTSSTASKVSTPVEIPLDRTTSTTPSSSSLIRGANLMWLVLLSFLPLVV